MQISSGLSTGIFYSGEVPKLSHAFPYEIENSSISTDDNTRRSTLVKKPNASQQNSLAEPSTSVKGNHSQNSSINGEQAVSQVVSQLKAADIEVRSHEAAHMAAGGQYVTQGASFKYQVGPDGHQYAIGGEVSIDTSPVSSDPEATIQKAQQIQSAALAPASPSSQDFRVAAAAKQMMMAAQVEARKLSEQSKISGEASHRELNNLSSDSKKEVEKGVLSQIKEGGVALMPERKSFELRVAAQT